MLGLERFRARRHAGDKARHVIGRPPEKTVRHFCDPGVGCRALAQVIAGPGANVIGGEQLSILFERGDVTVGLIGFGIINCRGRGCSMGVCRMGGHVIDLFTADIDHTAVVQTFEMFLAAAQHEISPLLFRV